MSVNPTKFTPAMIAGCDAALKAGIFYQDDFQKFVIEHIGGTDCNPVLDGIYTIDKNRDDFPKAYRLMVTELDDRIKSLPRGHYAIIERAGHNPNYSTIVSDGSGNISVGGKFDLYDVIPKGDEVINRMLGYEIFTCRKEVERRNQEQLNKEVSAKYHFAIGQSFKNLQSSEDYPVHKFATTTIIEIIDDNQIRLEHTKRGSKYRRTAVVSPTFLSEMIKWSGRDTAGTQEHVNFQLMDHCS